MRENVLEPRVCVQPDSVEHDGEEEEVVDQHQTNESSGRSHFKQTLDSEQNLKFDTFGRILLELDCFIV